MLVVLASGCSPYVRWPNLYHPGPAGFQRAVADKYDPYPARDVGPEIEGGRPRDYQRPLNETEWGRRYARPGGAVQPVPVPTFSAPPPPIFSSPQYPPAAAAAPAPPTVPFQQHRGPY
jgi:hypothetical protein